MIDVCRVVYSTLQNGQGRNRSPGCRVRAGMRPASRRTHAPALALVAVALAVGLAGCSGGGADEDSSSADGGSVPAAEQPADANQRGLAESSADQDFAVDGLSSAYEAEVGAQPAPDEVPAERAVIRKGNIALRADDVGKA